METPKNETTPQKPSHIIVAIRDVKAGFFHPPLTERSLASAVRSLTDAVSDSKQFISKHAADHQLYQLGSFFDDHGAIELLNPPLLVCEIISLKETSDVPSPQP